MEAQQSFQLLNLLALVFWIVLIFFHGKKIYRILISSGLAFILFGLVYLVLFLTQFNFEFDSFTSIEKMSSLYANPWLILLGWVHYLAFDLLAGVWIHNDANKNGISKALIIPSLLFTFMTGPFGLLSYLIIKYIKKKNAKVA
ncbi:MAG: ABA4-like family protein [Bacteroidales bacterium]